MRLNKYLFNRVNDKEGERGQRSVVWLKRGQPCLHHLHVLSTVFSWRPFSSFLKVTRQSSTFFPPLSVCFSSPPPPLFFCFAFTRLHFSGNVFASIQLRIRWRKAQVTVMQLSNIVMHHLMRVFNFRLSRTSYSLSVNQIMKQCFSFEQDVWSFSNN